MQFLEVNFLSWNLSVRDVGNTEDRCKKCHNAMESNVIIFNPNFKNIFLLVPAILVSVLETGFSWTGRLVHETP